MVSMEKALNNKKLKGEFNIETVKAVERLGKAGNFCDWSFSSKPQHIKADDGNSYVVKFKGNPQNTLILANEYVINSVSKLVGIPTPEFAVMNVGTKLLNFINKVNDTKFSQGSQFASRYIISNDISTGLKNAVNTHDWPKVIIFEILIQNIDFKKSHILLYTDKKDKKKKFCVVDHGFAFRHKKWAGLKPGVVWDSLSNPAFSDVIKHVRREGLMDKAINNADIKAFKLEERNIKNIVDAPVLEEWGIDKYDKEAITAYLSSFSENAKEIVKFFRR